MFASVMLGINLHPAVFLDRDGVVIENCSDYVKSWDEVVFIQGAITALQHLAASHYRIIFITNQALIGRGIRSTEYIEALHAKIVSEICQHGGRIDASYICPDASNVDSKCRKPAPGMLLQAQADHQIDLAQSFLIGDNITDIQAGKAANVTTLLVKTGWGAKFVDQMQNNPQLKSPIVENLQDAVQFILKGATSA